MRRGRVESLLWRGRHELDTSDYSAALATLTRVVRSNPTAAAARYYLARAHFFLGEVDQATKQLRKAVRLGAGVEALSSLATIVAFDGAMNDASILKYRKAFDDALRARLGRKQRTTAAVLLPRKILRVGYISSFFHAENWMKPVWGLIDHHDGRKVEVHLFSDSPRQAVVRRHARAAHARFHDISRLDNTRAARRIAASKLDILVDLNGYSKRGRLPLFLAKPAPLVVAWFNIFGTTGMSCFDAVIGDGWVVRKNEERWYVEDVIRLPMSYLTFDVTYPVPKVQPPPSLRNGFVTFGSLASLYKLNAQVIGAWAEILRRCPRSRLVLGNSSLGYGGNREYTLRRFGRLGVSPDRLTLLGGAAHAEFLKLYDLMDIALDTFPYNGGTTTSEAIWQGVPLLTFAGDRWISRTSATILVNAGLGEFVCRDLDAYVASAVRWGSSRNSASKLRELRSTMRRRLKKSPILDCSRFARLMEKTYRDLSEGRTIAHPAQGGGLD